MPADDGLDALESDLYKLRLHVATLYRLLVAKGWTTAEELRTLMDHVDAEDGALDSEFYGDVVDGDAGSARPN